MNFKKIMMGLVLIVIVIGLVTVIAFKNDTKNNEYSEEKLNVVVTSFSAYDFVKQIAGDKINLEFLLSPGVDSHSYEPTAQDISIIQNSDIFIYVGEIMEKWTDRVLSSLDTSDIEIIKLMDMVEVIEEQHIEGAEDEEGHEHEEEEHGEEEHEEEHYDEHIWSSPANSMIMVEQIAKILSRNDLNNSEIYMENAAEYIEEIRQVQAKIREIVDNRVRDRLVFGDKMPMQYFLNEFGLTVSAAFNGCSTETEPSVSTIAYLVNKVKEENIPVVLYIELNTGNVAKAIAEETGAIAMQIQSLHNITKDDFNNGETYVSLMTRNLDVLKKALQ